MLLNLHAQIKFATPLRRVDIFCKFVANVHLANIGCNSLFLREKTTLLHKKNHVDHRLINFSGETDLNNHWLRKHESTRNQITFRYLNTIFKANTFHP
ncbi:hypothetical protein Hanom_Chr02g00140131 [Helianthus anomalus]